MSLFNRILVEREEQRCLFVINLNNYDMFDDVEILRRLTLLGDDWKYFFHFSTKKILK